MILLYLIYYPQDEKEKEEKSANVKKIEYELVKKNDSWPCPYPNCNKVYKRRDKLVDHINRDHKKEKRYGCKRCNVKFYDKDIMKKHVISKHSAGFSAKSFNPENLFVDLRKPKLEVSKTNDHKNYR